MFASCRKFDASQCVASSKSGHLGLLFTPGTIAESLTSASPGCCKSCPVARNFGMPVYQIVVAKCNSQGGDQQRLERFGHGGDAAEWLGC